MKIKLVAAACVAGAVLLAANVGIATAAPPSFQFGITIGDPPPPPPPPHHGPHFPPPDYSDDCMSVRAIVSDLADQGYSRFRNYRDADNDYFFIDARRGPRLYRLTVDSCNGDILDRRRLYQPY
ncbi:MAG: hypothetical protein ACTHKD_04885 [Devosia sp.]|jgi:hypothetical protein|nr:hypothetical protein [Devosia sp.]